MEEAQSAKKRPSLLRLDAADNVAVACMALKVGDLVECEGIAVVLRQAVGVGFKVALQGIPQGAKVIKHGGVIGSSASSIAAGDVVHVHNLKSDYLQTVTLIDAMEAKP